MSQENPSTGWGMVLNLHQDSLLPGTNRGAGHGKKCYQVTYRGPLESKGSEDEIRTVWLTSPGPLQREAGGSN